MMNKKSLNERYCASLWIIYPKRKTVASFTFVKTAIEGSELPKLIPTTGGSLKTTGVSALPFGTALVVIARNIEKNCKLRAQPESLRSHVEDDINWLSLGSMIIRKSFFHHYHAQMSGRSSFFRLQWYFLETHHCSRLASRFDVPNSSALLLNWLAYPVCILILTVTSVNELSRRLI
jgi:hypothetical protein